MSFLRFAPAQLHLSLPADVEVVRTVRLARAPLPSRQLPECQGSVALFAERIGGSENLSHATPLTLLLSVETFFPW
ncbi:MAG TPA: hypothetical protein ENK38_01995 [Gammaproteobacteria bacterium]|nr:hypothetical protein [Gammaproteobacteria bacterium]